VTGFIVKVMILLAAGGSILAIPALAAGRLLPGGGEIAFAYNRFTASGWDVYRMDLRHGIMLPILDSRLMSLSGICQTETAGLSDHHTRHE
jgi:hypothetical protein